MTWTSLSTSAATRTLLFINLRKTCFWIDSYRTKLASSNTITTTQTTESAACLTSATGIHSCTSVQTIILGDTRTILARAITTHYSHLCLSVSHCDAQKVSHFAHHVSSTYRTHQSFDRTGISTLDKGSSHTRTTGKTTTTTISTWQDFSHLPKSRVFFDGKFLGYSKKNQCSNKRNGTKDQDCNHDKIHNYNLF